MKLYPSRDTLHTKHYHPGLAAVAGGVTLACLLAGGC